MMRRPKLCFILALSAVLFFLAPLTMPAQPPAGAQKQDKQAQMTRLTIEVTGGDDNKPMAEASVYVRFYQDRKAQKGKTVELNLKTNQEGVARSPDVPQGKILVQVIAPGWKSYGEWFDVQEAERTVQITLMHPSKWY
jgi:hypothetical protein